MGYCTWADINEANRIYHDTEWGIPVHDDRHMFEHLSLECLQCGLSWDLMLKKREIFRRCFDNFDYDKIAAYDDADVERILNTEGMIRSRRKVEAVINNARCYQKVPGAIRRCVRNTGAFADIFGRIPMGRQSCIRGMMLERFRSATGSPTESVKI